jgi:hypothetical protein
LVCSRGTTFLDSHALADPCLRVRRRVVIYDSGRCCRNGGDKEQCGVGNNIVIAALAIQVISFGLFIITAVIFQVWISKFTTAESYNNPDVPRKGNLYTLYAVSVLVLIRSIFRAVEYSMGYDGYALAYAWTLYVFDSMPMASVMVVYFWRYRVNRYCRRRMEGLGVRSWCRFRLPTRGISGVFGGLGQGHGGIQF